MSRERNGDEPAELQDFIDCARKTGGFLILEAWECRNCGAECHNFHKFSEIVQCGNCGQKEPSKIPLYKFAWNEAVDGR